MFDAKSLPSKVTVYEVGPRDGLQNADFILPTPLKVELVKRLIQAGLPAVEIASMVRPDLVPALADAEELLAELGPLLNTHRTVALVANQRGLERALNTGINEVAITASATESFAQANLNKSVAESLAIFKRVITEARSAGLQVRGYISMCFGDPWEGTVSPQQVSDIAQALCEYGITELSIGDTIGVATPRQVQELIAELDQKKIQRSMMAVHFHDTYGQALSNTLVALQEGITTVDASIGGLGGCPFAKSATGNLATEDLIYQLHGLGIETGVNLDLLVQTSQWLKRSTNFTIQSRASTALSGVTGEK
jgi:hydroxymethylglutaryl-CoA lyase